MPQIVQPQQTGLQQFQQAFNPYLQMIAKRRMGEQIAQREFEKIAEAYPEVYEEIPSEVKKLLGFFKTKGKKKYKIKKEGLKDLPPGVTLPLTPGGAAKITTPSRTPLINLGAGLGDYFNVGLGGGLTKPQNVDQGDWDLATDEQKRELLGALGQ